MLNVTNILHSSKVCIRTKRPIRSELICSVSEWIEPINRVRVFLLPQDGLLVHSRVTPSIKFTGNHLLLYTQEKKGTVRVKCLAQEFNTVSLVSTRNRITSDRNSCILHTSRISFAGVKNSVEANNATAQQNKKVTSCLQGLLWLLLIPSLPVKQ